MATLRVTNLRGRSGSVAPDLPDGANITGVCTATTFVGALTGTTGTFSGNVTVDNSITCNSGGDVQLYHDGAKKFETESWGAQFFDDVKFDNPDTAGRDVTWVPASDYMRWQDNTKAVFGDGEDLQIYHDGNHSRIVDAGQGNLKIQGSNLSLKNAADDKAYIDCIDAGAVEIYHNGSKKAETTSGGFAVTGTLEPTGTFTANGFNSNKALIEKVNITAGKLSDNLPINIDNGMVHLFTTAETTTSVPNIISTAGINTDLATGDAIAVTVITTAAAAGFAAEWQIDGIAVTETWVGGSAPSAGGASGTDTYSMNIIKTGSAAYTVIGNLTNAA